MEYIFILIFELLGIALSVFKEVIDLNKRTPASETKKSIWLLYKEKEQLTLGLSVVIVFLNLAVHAAINVYSPAVHQTIVTIPLPYDITLKVPFLLISFGIALMLGFAGQKLLYGWLGRTEKYLDVTPKV